MLSTMKNFYYFILSLLILFVASQDSYSQNVLEEDVLVVSEYSCDYTDRYYSSWRDNWFLQMGAGINQPIVERGIGALSGAGLLERSQMTVVYNFGVGRWMSPYLGFRLNAIGGALHWNNPTALQPKNGWSRGNHVNLNFEFMWDMLNSVGGVDQERVFSIIPFVGIGGDYMWNVYDKNDNSAVATNAIGDDGVKTSSWSLPVSAGIQFRFRLCRYVDFFAEARAGFYGDNWNLSSYGTPVDVNMAFLGGFNVNIGGRGWNVYNECDYVSQLASLNGQVNALRLALMETEKNLVEFKSQLPCPEPETIVVKEQVYADAPLMTSVVFKLDSYSISSAEEVNIYNMAEWLKNNPDVKINIVGYADKNTGTSEYNMKLSHKRAEAVADMLINKYGIDESRLNIKFEGSDKQPYSANDWNRIVIFSQE